MHAGAVTYTSQAPLSIGGADESTFQTASIGLAALVTGTNVLAVEIHQASPDSSDISFNLELTASLGNGTPLPTVTIAATDATASEPGTNTGTVTLTRTGSTTAPLTVNLTVGGTATNGVDYTTLASSVTIAAGSASATVLFKFL